MGGESLRNVPISGIVIWKSERSSEQESLELLVGPVYLVNEQYRRQALVRLDGLQQGPLDQELLGEEFLGPWTDGRLGPAASRRRISRSWRA